MVLNFCGLPAALGLKGGLIRELVRKYNETILVVIALHIGFGSRNMLLVVGIH